MPLISRMLLKSLKKYQSIINLKYKSDLRYFIVVDDIDAVMMREIVFEYIKFLKTNENPEDRVAWHEWHPEGLPDFDKLERLIEKRKTRKEIQAEINETIKEIQEYRKYKLNCDFIEEALKRKLGGL